MKFLVLLFLVWAVFVPVLGMAQNAEQGPAKTNKVSSVTAVYGVTADDYLSETSAKSSRTYSRQKARRSRSRVGFNLPDSFYYIGGPIFILILLWLITTFLKEFEVQRREEEHQAPRERIDPE